MTTNPLRSISDASSFPASPSTLPKVAPSPPALNLVPKSIRMAPISHHEPVRTPPPAPKLKTVPHFSVASPVSSKEHIQGAMKQRLGKIVHQMTIFDSKVPVGIKPLLTA